MKKQKKVKVRSPLSHLTYLKSGHGVHKGKRHKKPRTQKQREWYP